MDTTTPAIEVTTAVEYEWLFLVALPLLRGLWILLGYLTGNSFPKPLSEAEEAEYLQRHMAGDPRARNALIEHNLRLVAHLVKKFDNTGEDPDDLISIGTMGLIKAVDTFNPGKGTRLATYAARCIENDDPMTRRMRESFPSGEGRPARAVPGAALPAVA